MRDILPDLERWVAQQEPLAVATVVQTWGSSPRPAGAKMGLAPNNKITGSVSGGCIEGAVYEAGLEVIQTGRAQLLHFGVADENAWEVGLACGGHVEVLVNRLDPAFFATVRAALVEEEPAVVATVIRGPAEMMGRELLWGERGLRTGSLAPALDETALAAARQALRQGQTQRVRLTDEVDLLLEVLLPPPTLIAVGGVHITIALVALAKTLGYRTIVIDPRKAFGSAERFAHADQLIQEWPDDALRHCALTRSTAVAMLTHDPKLDDPALKVALPSPAFYVGALGSQTTQTKRRQRLLAEGLTEAQVNRLHGPIGLNLHARTPEEIALSIMAEIVAKQRSA